MELTVVHPRAIHRCKPGSYWVYADEKLAVYSRVAAAFSGSSAFMEPRDFQTAALELRPAFVRWVDENLEGRAAEHWILTPLHKNPSANNMLLHLVWLDRLAARSSTDDKVVVVTQSGGLMRTLQRFSAQHGIVFSLRGRAHFVFTRSVILLKAIGGFGYDVLQAMCRKALAGFYLTSDYVRRLRGLELLVDSFLTDKDVSESGSYWSPYFPGLVAWYQERGIRAAHYPVLDGVPLTRLGPLYRRLSRSEEMFVPFERFIKLSDVIVAVAQCLRNAFLPRLPRVTPFRGLNVNPLVQELRIAAAAVGLFPLLLLKAPMRLAACGIAPKWMIDWFENQPIDRANCAGFSRAPFPCKVVGVKQYPLYPNFTSLFTTSAEIRAGVGPKDQWVCGPVFMDPAREFDNVGSYRVVPALRYAHLYAQGCAERRERDLLVILTHSREESLGMLAQVIGVVPEIARFFERVVVGLHSDARITAAEVHRQWPEAFFKQLLVSAQGETDKFLSTARVAVSGGTSKALEAICRGIPVVLIGRRVGLDLNPLFSADTRLWNTAYGPEELRSAMKAWLPTHPISLGERINIGNRLRRGYFWPVTEEAMKAFDPRSERAPEMATA